MKIVKVAGGGFAGYPPKKTRAALRQERREGQATAMTARRAPRKAQLDEYARQLRTRPTNSERLFCDLLDSLHIEYEFQVVIAGYIPDFVFPRHKKIIELDGSCHRTKDAQKYDAHRDKVLREAGYKIRRIDSSLIFRNVDQLTELTKDFLRTKAERRALRGPKPERVRLGEDPLLEAFRFATAGL